MHQIFDTFANDDRSRYLSVLNVPIQVVPIVHFLTNSFLCGEGTSHKYIERLCFVLSLALFLGIGRASLAALSLQWALNLFIPDNTTVNI
jgi:hypothetical protein